MSTNYGHGDRPDDANQTEPIGRTNPTEPIWADNKTAPIDAEAGPAASSRNWDNVVDSSTKPAHPRRRPRVGTIVWGLIVIALAVVLILAELATLSLDMGQVMIGLLIGSGLALVVGGVISASNREKDDKYPYEAGN